MSDRIPKFWFGDRVRVMQTDEMVENGLANLKGTVVLGQRTPANAVGVSLDDDSHGGYVFISACALMKIERSGGKEGA